MKERELAEVMISTVDLDAIHSLKILISLYYLNGDYG